MQTASAPLMPSASVAMTTVRTLTSLEARLISGCGLTHHLFKVDEAINQCFISFVEEGHVCPAQGEEHFIMTYCLGHAHSVYTFHDQRHEGDDWGRKLALVGSQNLLVSRRVHDGLEGIKSSLQLWRQFLQERKWEGERWRGGGGEGGRWREGGGGISTLTASEWHTQYESTFHVCFILKTAGSERPKAMARNEFTSLKLLQLQHNREGGTEC